MRDYLGFEIKLGQRGVRVHSYGHSKDFKKITVVDLDPDRKYKDTVGILTDGNEKMGWTYPERIIVEDAFIVNL